MIYRFNAYGHPNILGTHKTTLEFTKDAELTLKGDCIVGVSADFELSKIKRFIKKAENNEITLTIKLITKNKKDSKIKELISAELSPSFGSNKEFVIRKTNFASERTFAINSNKAAFELKRDLIDFLKEKKNRVSIIIKGRH